jgi:hypothetical protein
MATSVFGQIKQKVQRSLSPLSSPVGSPKFRRRLAMRMQSPVFSAFASLNPYSSSSSNMAPSLAANNDGVIGPDSTYVSKPSTRQKRRRHRRKGGNYDLKAAEEFREVQSEPELESCDLVGTSGGGERRSGMASFLYKRKSSTGAASVIDGSCTVGRSAGKHQVYSNHEPPHDPSLCNGMSL